MNTGPSRVWATLLLALAIATLQPEFLGGRGRPATLVAAFTDPLSFLFGGGGRAHNEPPPPDKSDPNNCPSFFCVDTRTCVPDPHDCPCAHPLEKKCAVGDWFVCIRGDQDCSQFA